MGAVVNEHTGERVELRGIHLFGRGASSHTRLPDKIISSVHAQLRWENERWAILDVSRNGTFLNGSRLTKDDYTPLESGQKLCFATTDGPLWQLVDVSKPTPVLLPVSTQAEPIRFERSLLLPGTDSAAGSILPVGEGGWMLETLEQVHYFRDGDRLVIAEVEYVFQDNQASELTEIFEPNLAGGSIRVAFHLSTDEEHTQVRLSLGDAQLDLGERGHHYLLATLARKRLADAAAGIDPTAQGWLECEAVATMLGIDVQHVNVHIFRARQQIAKLAPSHNQLVNIVERRRGGVRLAALPFAIYRGSNLEGQHCHV